MNMVVSLGLSIDYSTHMALAFLGAGSGASGVVRRALTSIGPAILNGGVTSLVAVSIVAFSKLETFVIFFKVDLNRRFSTKCVMGLKAGVRGLPAPPQPVGLKSGSRRPKKKKD